MDKQAKHGLSMATIMSIFLEIWPCHHLLSDSHVVYNTGEREACDETNQIIPFYASVHKHITTEFTDLSHPIQSTNVAIFDKIAKHIR